MSAESGRHNPKPDQRLNRVRNYGPNDDGLDRNTDDEFKRRLIEATAAMAIQAPAGGGAHPSAASVAPARIPGVQSVIDRLHKYAGDIYGAYIFVGPTHDLADADQIPPRNPGYASTELASSLNDAHRKAVTMLGHMKPNARVAIIPISGVWSEDLTLPYSQIDICGLGRPIMNGHLSISPACNRALIMGMEIQSADDFPTVFIPMGPAPSTLGRRRGGLQFVDTHIHGRTTCWYSQRRFFMDQSDVWCDAAIDVTTERATMWVEAGGFPDDAWSVIQRSIVSAFDNAPPDTPSGLDMHGLAIKASSKLNGLVYDIGKFQPGIDKGGFAAYHTRPNSGLLISRSDILGSLLNEGWQVKHSHCELYAGFPVPERVGGVYGLHRGWSIIDPVEGRVAQIPANIFYDHCIVHGARVGHFIPDPAQVSVIGGPWGGAAFFRQSDHVCVASGAETTTFANFGSVAEAFGVNSSTACPNWTGAGFSNEMFVNSPTASTDPDMVLAMFDPM